MKYNFDLIANRKNTNSVKYDEFDVSLPMWVADMDFQIAPKIKEAIKKDLEVGAIGYSIVPNTFFEAFINIYKRRYDTTFAIDEMAYVSGVVSAIDSMIKVLCNRGDNVVMLSPIYHTFYHCIENNGFGVVTSEMIYKNHSYLIDFEDLKKKLSDEKSKVFLLCNPHNPIGKIFTKEELGKIQKLCDFHNVFIISDEIHGFLTNPKIKYIPFCKVAKNNKYVMTLATSKAFNLAGLQSACIVCKNKDYLDKFQRAFYRDDIGEPNYFAVNANIAALNECEDWLDEVNDYIFKNKCYLRDFLLRNVPSIYPIMSDATYMMWLDISNVSKDSKRFCNDLANSTGLLLSSGNQFGKNGASFVRINLATSLENVKLACEKLKEFVENK